MFDLKT